MNTDSFTLDGVKSEKYTLPDSVFGVKVDPKLLAQSVRVHLFNQRTSNAKTKTRGEIAKTTAKMYRQKGTGRARHGSYSAPIFVGGGVAHGPDGKQNYDLRMPRSMRKSALIEALSAKAQDRKVLVITGAEKASGKTKEIKNLTDKAKLVGSMLVVGTKPQVMWSRGWKNIKKSSVTSVNQLNAYSILAHKQLVLTAEAVKEMVNTYVG